MNFILIVSKRCLLIFLITGVFGCSSFTKQKIIGEWKGRIQMKGLDGFSVKTLFKDNGYYMTQVGIENYEYLGESEVGKWDYDGVLKMTDNNTGKVTEYSVEFESDDVLVLTDPIYDVKINCKRSNQ